MTAPPGPGPASLMDAATFAALYQRLRDASAWGPADRRGGLNYITPEQVLAAAGEVRLGRTVTLAAPIETRVAPDNPDPAVHVMTSPAGDQADPDGLSFATDRLAMNIHGNADSHIDALCHVIYQARLYNDVPADTVGATGAAELSIQVARNGIVGRGVLLDIPRLRGTPWLELGSDSNNDTCPSAAERVEFPVHVLAVNAMGLHLLDWLQLDDLAGLCEEAGRWSFCCVVAPLRLVRGTGSPVNPIAIL